jgi:hypothetical protein
VLDCAALETLDTHAPTVFVDFAGNSALRRRVHTHFDAALRYSCSVGGTHWQALGSGAHLPGPRPTLFFAPAQMKLRSGPPPAGWGPGGLQQRLGQAWNAFMQQVDSPGNAWLQTHLVQGPQALGAAYRALLEGQADPQRGLIVSL